jgi:multiple sugar transport system permease protein/raffinose/stachyose/melibiose transport system permease protein
MVLTSLRPARTALTGTLLPQSLSFNAYDYVWSSLHIWLNFLNSVVITGVAVMIMLVLSTLAGYAFARIVFVSRGFVFTLIISALFLPSVAILIPVYIELQQLHLLGNRIGLIFVYAATGIPFSVFLMRAFFEAIPFELHEAARVDGASELRTFARIMVPLAAPGLATVAIFEVLTVWNELLLANSLIASSNQQPLQPAVNALTGQYSTNWPALTAGMTLSAIPMVIAYLLCQRWFVRGLTAGAVKS